MEIRKIIEKPFRRRKVKNLPKDAKYTQHSIDNHEVYYSKTKNSYYVVAKKLKG